VVKTKVLQVLLNKEADTTF